MTLATICQNVAQDLGIDEPPTPIWGSKLPTARRLIAQARRTLWSIVRRGAWAPLVIEYEFTANGGSDYQLPPDLLKIVDDTVWESTRYWAMRGSLSPQQWQRYRRSIYGRATIWRRWRIRVPSGQQAGYGTRFSLDPPVAATDNVSRFVFEYVSVNAVQQPSGAMVSDWTGDNDHAIVGEVLIELGTRWRMLRRMGLAYDDEKDEYEREIDKAVARSGGMMILNLVPWHSDIDFIGQFSLGAFPPQPPIPGPAGPLPADIAQRIAPFEGPQLPPEWLSRPPPLRPGPARQGRPPAADEEAAVVALLARASAPVRSTEALAAPAVRRSGAPRLLTGALIEEMADRLPIFGSRPMRPILPPEQWPPGT
jgi:hypothetical protein